MIKLLKLCLLCNRDFKPICVIELDDSTHLSQRAQKNDNFKNELFKTLGLKLVRIKVVKQKNLQLQIE